MLNKITLQFGTSTNAEKLVFVAQNLTIFVGPNNSGKSTIIRELDTFIDPSGRSTDYKILENFNCRGFSDIEINEIIERTRQEVQGHDEAEQGKLIIGRPGKSVQVSEETLKRALKKPNQQFPDYRENYLKPYTTMLSGLSRLNVLKQPEAGSPMGRASSPIQEIYYQDEKGNRVSELIHEAFGYFLVIDGVTQPGQLHLLLSLNDPSEINLKEQATPTRQFFSEQTPITEFGDGIKSYVATVVEMVAGNPAVLLLDEPEAHLHPTHAFLLGKLLGSETRKVGRQVIASTHSSHFIMGCLQANVPANIVRLTNQNQNPTARVLEREKLNQLMNDPLLRSNNVLDALFYDYVVVTESDIDRILYQEINQRLLDAGDTRGIQNCLFVGGLGKGAMFKIIQPLRELGIPTAGVIDIDFINDSNIHFKNLLGAIFFPPPEHEALNSKKEEVFSLFRNAIQPGNEYKKRLKKNGISELSGQDRALAQGFFTTLNEYGLFPVVGGELESWLKSLGVGQQKNKTKWLVKILEGMGKNSTDSNYLAPTSGDVWDFIKELKIWFANPQRKGGKD